MLILQEAKDNIKNNWKQAVMKCKRSIKQETTRYTSRMTVMFDYRLVVPRKLRLKILEEMHKTHLRIVKMKSLARSYFWWPGITEDIEQMINKCRYCYSARSNPQKITKEKWPSLDIPWERVNVDFFMYQRQNYLLLVDAFSKWSEVFKMISATASSTISRLKDVFFKI
jgi:Integrase zinc binding domain